MELWWAFLILGAVVGFLAGLLGIGGGGIMVPVLTSLFMSLALTDAVHCALATSLAAIIVTAFASARSHHQHQAVLWPVVWSMSPGIVVGTLVAAFFAAQLPDVWLAWFFCAFMAWIALQMFFNIKPRAEATLPATGALAAVGACIGAISALVAIGGGSLTVPFLTWCQVKMQQAIGTSAALGLPIAISGTLGYIGSGVWHHAAQSTATPWQLGFVYMPAVLFISMASVFTAPLGARLAHRLPTLLLKKLFALLLFGLSGKMLHSVAF